jgi:hypothetical protein
MKIPFWDMTSILAVTVLWAVYILVITKRDWPLCSSQTVGLLWVCLYSKASILYPLILHDRKNQPFLLIYVKSRDVSIFPIKDVIFLGINFFLQTHRIDRAR